MDTIPVPSNTPDTIQCEICQESPEAYAAQVFYPGIGGIPEPIDICVDCDLDATTLGAVVAKVLGGSLLAKGA